MPQTLKSHIDSVTIHLRGAIVSRVATLPDGPLDEPFRIGPLPLAIDDGSVRVRLQDGGGLRATAVRVTLDAPDPDPSLSPARPEDLSEAEGDLERLRDALSAAQQERRRIEALTVVPRPDSKPGEPPSPSPAAARLELLALRDRRLRELDARLHELAFERDVASRRLADLRARDARASSMRQTEPDELRKAVEVVLRGARPEGGQATMLHVEYQVDAARWAPTYTLRLDAAMSDARLEMRAAVAQYTGEDWRDVRLTLSTARLSGWAELPELRSIRVGRQQPARRSGWRPAPAGGDALFTEFDRARLRPEEPPPVAADDSPKATESPAPPDGGATLLFAAPVAAPIVVAPLERAVEPALALPASARAGRARFSTWAAAAPRAKKRSTADVDAALAAEAAASEEVGDAFGGAPEPPPPRAAMSRDMLDFGALRLFPADAPQRGKLIVRTREQLYAEYISETTIEVDIAAALRSQRERAQTLDDATLPPGCRPPAPSGFDYVYEARGRIDAPSDAVFHNLPVTAATGTAHARFVVVPRESQDVFRFVEMHNSFDAPLLAGPIDVVVGGDFLLTSTVDQVPEGGLLRLGLGVEQRIKVSRNTHFSEKTGGLMGGKLELRHRIEIGVENLLPREAELEVRERVPVTREGEDDIRIEEKDVAPPWRIWEPAEQPDLRGGRMWQLSLPPGAKQDLQANYTVRISSKYELAGGNRREG